MGTTITQQTITPRIYVACLAGYNNGKPMGAKVFKLLSDGLKTTPPATLYNGNDPARATWYRFE
jgi:hypothetical protein